MLPNRSPHRALAAALPALAALLVLAAPARAAADPPAARRTLAAIDAGAPRALALLEALVNQNSGTGNAAGVKAVADQFAPRFRALGFDVRWIDGAAFGRAGHLVATRHGRRAKLAVLLVGHLDTVFEADSPFQRFTRLDDTTATGPGIADMKGGDVIALLALEGLSASGAIEDLDVRVVFDGDEESPGHPLADARRALTDAARGCDVAIGFENGAGRRGEALTARRGSSGWVLRTSGHRSHSGQLFRDAVGFGAVYEAARILDAFRDSLAGEPHLTFNPGLVLGGSSLTSEPGSARGSAEGKTNVVAETTLVTGDLRTLTPEQLVRAREVMTRIVARHLPRTDATITFSDGYPPLAPAPAHDALLAAYDRASRDLGAGPVVASNPDDAGAADVSFVATLVPMVMDGVGLAGDGGHSIREHGDLASLALNARRVALTLQRLAAARR